MSARNRFKETEIGWIPEEWEVKPLRSLTTKTQTVNPAAKPDEPFEYIDVSSVSNESFRITGSTTIRGADAPSRARKEVQASDVLFATVRPTLRRVALVPPHLHGQVASTAFCVVRANQTVADPTFLYFSLLTDNLIAQLAELERGANYPAVTDGNVLDQLIVAPPLPEQRAIAWVLGKIQAAVEAQENIIATLRELKQATMAKLFREGLRGEPLKETEIGEMPQSWEVMRLGEVVTTAQYGLSVRGERIGQYPILRMNCLVEGRVTFDDLQFVNLDDETYQRFRLNDGDLLFNRTNSIDLVGKTGVFHGDRPTVFASYMIRLIVNHEMIDPDYLNCFLNLDSTQAALKGLATRGVSQSNISATRLREFFIPLPLLDEQREIANTADAIAKRKALAERKHAALQALFKTMLHQLMTGQIRVKDLGVSSG